MQISHSFHNPCYLFTYSSWVGRRDRGCRGSGGTDNSSGRDASAYLSFSQGDWELLSGSNGHSGRFGHRCVPNLVDLVLSSSKEADKDT